MSIKFVTTKPRLKKLFEFMSIGEELDTLWLKYNKNFIFQKQIDPSYIFAVITKINKTFFTEYHVDDEGEVKISTSLYKVIDKYFKEVENIEFSITDTRLTLKGKDEIYETSLLQIELPTIEAEIEEKEFGFLPKLESEIKGIYGIDAEDWSVKADLLKIYYGNTLKLSVTLEEGGTYTRATKILDKKEICGEGVITIDGKVFKNIIDLFSGPLYMVITSGPIILSQKTSDYTITYVIAPRAEE